MNGSGGTDRRGLAALCLMLVKLPMRHANQACNTRASPLREWLALWRRRPSGAGSAITLNRCAVRCHSNAGSLNLSQACISPCSCAGEQSLASAIYYHPPRPHSPSATFQSADTAGESCNSSSHLLASLNPDSDCKGTAYSLCAAPCTRGGVDVAHILLVPPPPYLYPQQTYTPWNPFASRNHTSAPDS